MTTTTSATSSTSAATTTGTVSTAATAAATSTSSVVSNAAQQLLSSLGTGSGVDTTSLVSALVTAQFAAQTAALTTQATTITTQISGVSALKSAVTGFASALDTLVKSGSLTTQPVSGDSSVFTATAQSGATLAGLSSSIAVSQLAAAQTVTTKTAVTDRTAAIGTGTFTLTFGTAIYGSDKTAMTGFTAGTATPVTIDIADGASSLDGIAAAINAKKAGITASIVTDSDGSAYLSLKSATGAAQAFTLQATTDTSGALSTFNVGVGATGTTITSGAQNAKVTVDGVAVQRASNSISDLIAGVDLKLVGTSPVVNNVSTAVALTSSTPTDALAQAISDVTDTYNEVLAVINTQTDPVNGPLKNDTAAKSLLKSLQALTTKPLVTNAASGTPTTLAELGVITNRDGTLKVDTNLVAAALKANPASVEAMFAYSSSQTTGISALLNTWSATATDNIYGLGASATKYTAAQTTVTDEQTDITTQSATVSTRLTQQYATMNSQIAAYKSTQSFLTQQVAQWSKSS